MAFSRKSLPRLALLVATVVIWIGCKVSLTSAWILQSCEDFSSHGTRSKNVISMTAISSNYNCLIGIQSLKNDYFALRHGQSLANVAKIIASNPDVAISKYGLSELGKRQAEQAAADVVQVVSDSDHYQGVILLSSDLLRAKQTAETVAAALTCQAPPCIPLYNQSVLIDKRLRERWFGQWDGGPDVHYHDVWKEDALDPSHENAGVESVLSVIDRSTRCIVEWESRVSNHMIVCVAHGDVLQILQTAFNKMDGSLHRSLDHLETAQLRPLRLFTESTSRWKPGKT